MTESTRFMTKQELTLDTLIDRCAKLVNEGIAYAEADDGYHHEQGHKEFIQLMQQAYRQVIVVVETRATALRVRRAVGETLSEARSAVREVRDA